MNSSLGRAVTVLLAALTLIVPQEYCFVGTSPSSWLANYSHNLMKLNKPSWSCSMGPCSLPVGCFCFSVDMSNYRGDSGANAGRTMVTKEIGIADSLSFGVHERGAVYDQQRGASSVGFHQGPVWSHPKWLIKWYWWPKKVLGRSPKTTGFPAIHCRVEMRKKILLPESFFTDFPNFIFSPCAKTVHESTVKGSHTHLSKEIDCKSTVKILPRDKVVLFMHLFTSQGRIRPWKPPPAKWQNCCQSLTLILL